MSWIHWFSLLPHHSARHGWRASRATCERASSSTSAASARLGVGRAGEHEVLPHEQAAAVAARRRRRRARRCRRPRRAACSCSRRRASLDQPLVALVLERADERVGGDPVRAAREDADAVEHEAEEARAGLVGVRPLVELERADADAAARARRASSPPASSVDAQVVQRGLAEVVRPPQRRVVEREVGGRRGRRAASRRARGSPPPGDRSSIAASSSPSPRSARPRRPPRRARRGRSPASRSSRA